MMAKTKKIKKETVVTQATLPPEGGSNNDALFDVAGQLVVDVFETKDQFVVRAAAAGVSIEDLDISIEKDMIVIKGNRQDPHTAPEVTYFYQECYFGPFYRSIVLPEDIHTEKAAAEMDKGMLTIKIPKKGASK